MHLLGRRPLSVSALGSAVGTRGSRQRHDAFALLVLRFDGGLSAKIAAHGCCRHPHFHRLSVFATGGSFLGEFPGAVWIDSDDPERPPRPETGDYPGRSRRGAVLASFLDAVADPSRLPLVDEADSFAAMSVCFAAQRSVRSGRECPIDYVA
jgi:predicted dehydrogenase